MATELNFDPSPARADEEAEGMELDELKQPKQFKEVREGELLHAAHGLDAAAAEVRLPG